MIWKTSKHKNNQFRGFKTIQVKDLVFRLSVTGVSTFEYSNFDREVVEGTDPAKPEYKLNIVKTRREDKPRAR